MKKIMYFLVLIISIGACKSNDDDLSMSDPLIGTWQLTSEKENGIETATDCSKQTTISFLENSTTTFIGYYEDGTSCMSETDSFNWKNIGNSNYEIMYDANDKETILINFSNNNTVFEISTSEVFDNVTYSYSSTYTKK